MLGCGLRKRRGQGASLIVPDGQIMTQTAHYPTLPSGEDLLGQAVDRGQGTVQMANVR